MLAVLAMITLVGIPLEIGLLAFLLPGLWFLGYIVAATRLGGFLAGLSGRKPALILTLRPCSASCSCSSPSSSRA